MQSSHDSSEKLTNFFLNFLFKKKKKLRWFCARQLGSSSTPNFRKEVFAATWLVVFFWRPIEIKRGLLNLVSISAAALWDQVTLEQVPTWVLVFSFLSSPPPPPFSKGTFSVILGVGGCLFSNLGSKSGQRGGENGGGWGDQPFLGVSS